MEDFPFKTGSNREYENRNDYVTIKSEFHTSYNMHLREGKNEKK